MPGRRLELPKGPGIAVYTRRRARQFQIFFGPKHLETSYIKEIVFKLCANAVQPFSMITDTLLQFFKCRPMPILHPLNFDIMNMAREQLCNCDNHTKFYFGDLLKQIIEKWKNI